MAEIKAIQFELWQNCSNNCQFCFLNKSRIVSNPQQQIKHINKVIEILNSSELDEFDGIALIGGEFFEGQLSNIDVKNAWFKLIDLINDLLLSKKIKQVWITASLMSKNQDDLYETLNRLPVYDEMVMINTSYDSIGRFSSDEGEKVWYNNVTQVKKAYPTLVIHTTIITTQHFIEKVLSGSTIIQDINIYSLIDFKLPTIYSTDFINGLSNTGNNEKEYRAMIFDALPRMPHKFFIEKRLDFITFMKEIYKIFGKEKLKNFCSNKVLAKSLHLLSDNIHLDDRWGYSSFEIAKCKHHLDSYCYLDSDKCVRCDINNFINELD